MIRAVAIALLAVSCGPSTLATNPPLAEKSDEPWVARHRELVTDACACGDSACLEELKARIDALVAEHGGLDNSPAEVHVAHGELEQCYQAGTRDPVRDLEVVVRKLCGCATEACVKQAMIARLEYSDKYGSPAKGDVSSDKLAGLEAEYARCKSDKIISGDELATHYEKIRATVCACAANNACGTRLTDLPPMPTAVMVTELSAHEVRIARATELICTCATNAKMTGTYGGFAVTRRCKPPETK